MFYCSTRNMLDENLLQENVIEGFARMQRKLMPAIEAREVYYKMASITVAEGVEQRQCAMMQREEREFDSWPNDDRFFVTLLSHS